MEEHRTATRKRVLKAGTIAFGGETIACTVRNISDSGAALDVATALWFPDRFTLGIESDRFSKPCHIVWRKEKRIGVAFE
jgi:PilZ domain